MLWRVLQSNGGLPDEARVIFCNTGLEDEATMKFVEDCQVNWRVPITWLEYRLGPTFEMVKFETARRNGEPFDDVIKQREPSLPNGRSRYCSSELKTRTMHRYFKSLGWTEWDSFVGIRADEPKRVAKFRANNHPEGAHESVHLPLAIEGISALDVHEFWNQQPFTLGLESINGHTPSGNCRLCYLKPPHRVLSLIKERPESATWYIKHEAEAAKRCTGDGQFFAIDRPSYAQMLKFSQDQRDMFDPQQEAISCFCGD